MLKIASLLLQYNSIAFDKEEFSFQIQSHPSYPSLHSITGVLDHFNIENVAAKVPVSKETLNELPSSFLAQINNNEAGLELVLIKKSNEKYQIYDSEKKKRVVSTESFLNIFTGIILAVEKDEHQKAEKTSSNSIHKISLLVLTGCLFVLYFNITPEIVSYASLLLSFVGVFISISIVKQELGIKNAIGDAFCSSTDEKKDCDAVLSSKGATLIKGYKLSGLSLIYFVGFGISILLLSFQNLGLQEIFLISILGLPITLYSLYYQAFIIKKWCFLCLSLVGVLWIQAAMFFFLLELSITFELQNTLTIIFSFLTVFTIWNILKPKYDEAQKNKDSKIEYYKFKRKFSLFSTLIKNNALIDTNLKPIDEIIFGNKNSNLEIVIITNPFCGHCKPVHKVIEDVLHQYKDEVKIIIRFNIPIKDLESDVVKITSSLLRLYFNESEETCLLAMGEIYNGLSPKKWLQKWEINFNNDAYLNSLSKQKDWCAETKINFTPEILINGRSFPKEYERQDLIYFIEELHEECNVNLKIQETV
ncbi:MAG: thioredoxin domain-containing protein [Flavobacteriaceae bacterium]|nr:thioredoxin domain-containing protein [Flavobacteriaceae bacterium]